MRVLCFGSANIDDTYTVPHMVARGETLAATSVTRRSGGKGLNQAIALARGGARVSFAGAVGSDGAFLLEELAAAGVDTARARVLDHERTGTAMIQTDPSGDNCILLYGGANRCITEEQVDETLAAFEAGDLVALQNEVNLVGYIARQAHAKGMAVALNPSPMDGAIADIALEVVDYLLVNEIEAAQLLDAGELAERKDWQAVAERLAARLPDAVVVLTLGGEGSCWIADGEATFFPAASCEVVDTTAAGDTFTGFLLSALMRGEDFRAAMELAARAAAVAVSRPGAAASIPALAEVR